MPANGDGPFQIVSKDYGNGEITEEIFKQTIQDFIDFAKNKIDNYNNRADDEFPPLKISYTSFDYTGVVSFAALYIEELEHDEWFSQMLLSMYSMDMEKNMLMLRNMDYSQHF